MSRMVAGVFIGNPAVAGAVETTLKQHGFEISGRLEDLVGDEHTEPYVNLWVSTTLSELDDDAFFPWVRELVEPYGTDDPPVWLMEAGYADDDDPWPPTGEI